MDNTHIIAKLDEAIAELKALRKELSLEQFKHERKYKTTDVMLMVVELIKEHPGADRVDIQISLGLDDRLYQNTMTSLNRKGMVVNLGTRRSPSWYVCKEEKEKV